MNKNILVLMASLFVLTACGGSDTVKTEEYQFAGGLQLLDLPPNLTRPDKNLIMEIPKPSLVACEKLMEANSKFGIEKARKEKAKKEMAKKEQAKKEAVAK